MKKRECVDAQFEQEKKKGRAGWRFNSGSDAAKARRAYDEEDYVPPRDLTEQGRNWVDRG